MTTRLEDGINVLGIENKSLVEEIEIEFQKEKITKSQLSQMIERAVADADSIEKAEYRNDDGSLVIPKAEFEPLIGILNRFSDESGITATQDNLTESLNSMLKWISSYTEIKSTVKDKNMKDEKHEMTEEEMDEEHKKKVKKKEKSTVDEIEKCEEYAYEKPYGGATSLASIRDYQKASEMEFSVYRLYSWFGAASQNILSGEGDISNKMVAMQNLLTEFKSMLTPAGLSTLKSVIKDEETNVLNVVNSLSTSIKELSNKVDNLNVVTPAKSEDSDETPKDETEVEVPAWKSIVDKMSNVLKDAVTKPEQERREVFQGMLTEMANDLLVLDKSLSMKSEITPEINSIERVIDEKLTKQAEIFSQQTAILNQQIADLTNAIQNIATTKSTIMPKAPNVPVSKSIIPPPVLLQPNNPNKLMSIREAALRSTLGR